MIYNDYMYLYAILLVLILLHEQEEKMSSHACIESRSSHRVQKQFPCRIDDILNESVFVCTLLP